MNLYNDDTDYAELTASSRHLHGSGVSLPSLASESRAPDPWSRTRVNTDADADADADAGVRGVGGMGAEADVVTVQTWDQLYQYTQLAPLFVFSATDCRGSMAQHTLPDHMLASAWPLFEHTARKNAWKRCAIFAKGGHEGGLCENRRGDMHTHNQVLPCEVFATPVFKGQPVGWPIRLSAPHTPPDQLALLDQTGGIFHGSTLLSVSASFN